MTEPAPQTPPSIVGLAPTPGGGWVPVPDPTERTTRELRRELATQREIVEAQMQSFVDAMRARLDAMDVANELRLAEFRLLPAAIREQVSHLKALHDEKFASIELQFSERDVRTEQAATASASALAAALQAAKEAVFENSQAAAKAAEKVEQSFTKQIDQIGLRIDTEARATDARITELKERIDRGEGSSTGAAFQRTEQRLTIGQIVAVVAVIVAVVSVMAFILKK